MSATTLFSFAQAFTDKDITFVVSDTIDSIDGIQKHAPTVYGFNKETCKTCVTPLSGWQINSSHAHYIFTRMFTELNGKKWNDL